MSPSDAMIALRSKSPLVHCITNYVAMNIAANVTLAAGASPAMIHAQEEVIDFVPVCGALTINIGTISAPWLESMLRAADAAEGADVPWVLDPVAHFATPFRRDAAQLLLSRGPTIVRGNASEIIALAGSAASGKGADSGDSVGEAKSQAMALAKDRNCIVAVTGAEDFVTDGDRHASIVGGAEIMPKVTALGCSLTALVGAYAAVAPALDATVAALAHFAVAGERAAEGSDGPGSFAARFLDALYLAEPADLEAASITWS